MLTVFFRCDQEPNISLTQELVEELEKRLEGTRVRVEWCSKNKSHEDENTVFDLKPSVKTAGTPVESAPTGKRIIYGGFVASNRQTPIVNLKIGADKITIEGYIVSVNERNSFKNKRMQGEMNFPLDVSVCDGTDSVYCSLLLGNEEQKNKLVSELEKAQKNGEYLLAQGVCRTSHMTGELVFYANNVCLVPHEKRQDESEQKRVELHLHTRMSMLDGITDVERGV